ncbi:cytidine deaminase-like [Lycorma delicatula]|uniref:cytidine deaminase-like n=1 Tax=Lycorma delicatula TaxID=130591 RepID=UPI003F50DFD5
MLDQLTDIQKTGNVCEFSSLGQDVKELLKASVKAQELAYTPYSKFNVGAALRCDDGTVYTGCNVENASYGLGICAERTAIVKAVSEGKQKYNAIAVSASFHDDLFVTPCGACRQVISEFSVDRDIVIYLTKPALKKVFVTSVKQLLPLSFSSLHINNHT